jgi:hypothetical protein
MHNFYSRHFTDYYLADACLLTLNGALFLIGGSKSKYRYADDPSKVWVLPKNGDRWRDDILPPIIGARMWPGTRDRCYDHNFLRFLTIFGKKLAFFLKTNVMIKFFHNLPSFVLSQKRQFFRSKKPLPDT